MKTEKFIGSMLILGAVGVFIPYTILSIVFDYPNILRQDPGIILTKFYEGGASLILIWFLFAILGLPLLAAYISLGQKLENKFSFVRFATTLGVISLVVQMIGLLRWTFVVPLLADNFLHATNLTSRESIKYIFQTIHQFGGVLLGEHLGQLFTVGWTVMTAYAFNKLKLFENWVIWFGYIASAIYLLAQAELFKTVIPNFPAWEWAGLIGSTMWLVWLIIVGLKFFKVEIK
jgi:hypothetical protein